MGKIALLNDEPEFLPFTMRFAVDIAAGFKDTAAICKKHDVDQKTFEALMKYKVFTDTVNGLTLKMSADGSVNEIKAQMYLEELLDEARQIATDPDENPKARAAAMELIRKVATPKAKKETTQKANFTFNIINVDGRREPEAIDVTAVPVKDEDEFLTEGDDDGSD